MHGETAKQTLNASTVPTITRSSTLRSQQTTAAPAKIAEFTTEIIFLIIGKQSPRCFPVDSQVINDPAAPMSGEFESDDPIFFDQSIIKRMNYFKIIVYWTLCFSKEILSNTRSRQSMTTDSTIDDLSSDPNPVIYSFKNNSVLPSQFRKPNHYQLDQISR
ncbi:hypothetical protein CEXT_650371 [Caerostris extrusa]|uniref:Uncharacterized protein n=1 Tax=Caerostris extrusa TaxID=172846 RepID=A0AAV4MYT6_CAEEX|nr:hypothetical protein CEXT_650371 [Caerostris extrusa]